MEGIEVKIDKEAVERRVVDAIINSSIGEKIEKGIQDALKGDWHDKDPIQKALDKTISETIYIVSKRKLEGEFTEMVERIVKERITEATVSKILDTILDNMLNHS